MFTPQRLLVLLLAIAVSGCAGEPAGPEATNTSSTAAEASPEAAFGSVTGQVTTDESQPIAGADVTLSGTEHLTKSDQAGAFTFNNIEPGEYSLHVQRIGFEQAGRKITVIAGEVTEVAVQLSAFVVAEEAYVDMYPRKALIEFGQVFLDNRYPAGYRLCSSCDSYLTITPAPTEVRLEQTFTNGADLPSDDIWIDFRINFKNETASNSQNDGDSLGSDYLADREAFNMSEDGVKALAKVDKVWYHVASGLVPSINKKIDSFVSFSYNGPLPEGYTALPPQ